MSGPSIRHRIMVVDQLVCWVDDGGVLACRQPNEPSWRVPGKFTDVVPGGMPGAALRTDGSILTEWAERNDDRWTLRDCSAGACTEYRPSHGKFVDLAIDGYDDRNNEQPKALCGLLDDGRVECPDHASIALPDVPLTQIALSSGDGMCGVDLHGYRQCWGAYASFSFGPTADVNPTPVVQLVTVEGGQSGGVVQLDASGEGKLIDNGGVPWSYNLPRVSFIGPDAHCGLSFDDGSVVFESAWDLNRISPPAGSFVQIASDRDIACALRPNGELECWGADWGTGGDTEMCGLHRAVLSGKVGDTSVALDADAVTLSGIPPRTIDSDDWEYPFAIEPFDMLVLRGATGLADFRWSLQGYSEGTRLDLQGTLVQVERGNSSATYCAGAGSSGERSGDELTLSLANVTELAACDDAPVSGMLEPCSDDTCSWAGTLDGVSVDITSFDVGGPTFGGARVIELDDGTLVEVQGRRALVFMATRDPLAGAVYCADVVMDGVYPTLGNFSRVGTCSGGTSGDTLTGCVRE